MRIVLALLTTAVLILAGCIGETQTNHTTLVDNITKNDTNQTLNISKNETRINDFEYLKKRD